MALIIPKCNAESRTLDLTLEIYYKAADWLSNADLIEQLSSELIKEGIEDEKKEPQSYTKKTQVLSYYGFIEWEDASNTQSRRRITTTGKKFFELRQRRDTLAVQELLVSVLNEKTFGRNVLGCDSDSDLEAPNIFLKSALILGELTNKEFAYILGRMELHGIDFADVLFEVLIMHKKGIKVVPEQNAAKWADPKPILALADWGLFTIENHNNSKYYYVNKDVIENLGNELATLRIKNTEELHLESKFIKEKDASCQHSQSSVLAPYFVALRTKPFMLLAGISGTGKSRIVRELAFKSCPKDLQDKDGTTPGNYCMVEVKPNWHDSTELLGYWSNLHGKYIFTKFVKFLVKAKMYPNVPFFVCLDEMNLAPVEQYFAEFLSVLETRRIVKDGEDGKENAEVKTGALVDKDNFISFGAIGDKHLENNRQIYFKLFNINDREMMERIVDSSNSLLKDGLTLPENVFVVGTVNMDDTTHQFSRKVIDRAMTIEMNGGALEDIFNNDGDLKYTDEPLTMDNLRSKYVTANDVIEKCSTVAADEQICKFIKGSSENGLPQRLQAINTVLAGTPFTVSYRVMNELTIYLAVLLDKAEEEGKEVNFDTFMPYVETAIDKILLMKILPRVEGDDEMFRISEKERRINELDSQVNDEDGMSHEFTKLDWLKQIAPQHNEDNEKEYMAVDKLSEMIDRLNRQSFTRYWP